MTAEPTTVYPVTDLLQAAHDLAAEVAGTVEYKKKTIAAPPGLQMFLLYVRAKGQVPLHHVTGAITVHTILGNATLAVDGRAYVLALGNVLPIADGVPHAVSAIQESVLLVTHALKI
jgi:quercetin dioxygenase-like cupin family protein